MLTQLIDAIRLTRDVEGFLIPDGARVKLPAGSPVVIRQSLGGDYTIRTDCGDMVRIAGEDADALGEEVAPAPARLLQECTEDSVWDQLRLVYDPEIPISIVELGLVYDVDIETIPSGGKRVEIRMTLTAPGCGMGEVLKQDVERKVGAIPGVEEVRVEVVFDPPWNQSRMSEVARLELGLF